MLHYRDLYIIKWLLQKIERQNTNIVYQYMGWGSYQFNFNKDKSRVRVKIGMVQGRPYARVVVKFTSPGFGEVQVVEPIRNIFSLTRQYATPEEAELAETLKRLLAVIVKQRAVREQHDIETEDQRKQKIFHRLLEEGE